MTFIWKEVPTWTIDWVNNVFTLLNDVDYIDDIFVDWAIYTTYTRSWKVLTLSDAPVVAILVDYHTWTATTPVTTDCTYWDIKTKVWSLLGQLSSSTNFNESIIWAEINARAREIWKGKVINKLNPWQYFRAWRLYFRDKSLSKRIKSGGTLSADLWVWDVTATLTDTTNLLSSWYVEIWWDTIKYTWKTSTTITWISWQTIDHLATEKVIQLYEMPVNMHKPSKVEYIVKWADTSLRVQKDIKARYVSGQQSWRGKSFIFMLGMCNRW